ncbi:hypothetical protein BC941DRAFT_460419 [Chlamydoabsidia padenii]|nr:hypothetical protein BC941DRAFT_460419 [Chlamydoabsidia padenii]
MTSYATRTQSSTEQNDLKKLKSKYSSKLPTLKELFADWSDEDLLFALDEADGVLEVAVDRISEGHATQWGEVKTKKAKKEAQQKAKAAAAASVPSSAQTMSYQKPERTYTERPKPTKARVPSTNNNSRKPATTTSSWGYNSGQKSSLSSSALDSTGGSWASIASTKPAHDSSSDWNSTSNNFADNSITSVTNDSWNQPSWSNDEKEITETTTSSALLDDTDKPKSWASLLKSQPKPEPVQKPGSEWTSNEEQHTTEGVEDVWNTKDDEPVKDEWSAPVETPVDAWSAPVETPGDAWGSSTPAEPEPVEEQESKKVVHQLTEDSPVVMPKNDATVSSVDVKFGSLNLDDDTNTTVPVAQEPTHVEESLTDTKVESQSQPQAAVEPVVEQNTTTTTNASAIGQQQQQQQQPVEQTQQASYLKQEPAFTQPQTQAPAQLPGQVQSSPAQPPSHQQPQIQQTQQIPQLAQQIPQHQQQQPFGMDHLTSAYSSYLPNQHPTGMSGFGMSPMGNLPDYGAYGTEAQRAAAMGYYDPSSFNNSPAVTNASSYPSRDKFGQDSSSIGTPQGQSTPGQNQGLHGQQMYPSMPYYPYYYMPNHYNAYQQSMYGQPMMNKNMYPNMYQQQQQQPTASVSKPSTQSPYGGNGVNVASAATASPYALHSQLYGQQPSNVGGMGGGYDDLQQQFGLHDYQKSPYGNAGGQQLQGFLGHHLQGQQQPGQQPSQQGQGQGQSIDPTKNDASSRGNVASSSQPQQQPHQMNYFGQQHMFNYQQYPQQQYWNQ